MIEHTTAWASSDPFIFSIIVLLALLIHFLPSFIAFSREHKSRMLILLLNVVLGWTGIGWIVLMIWAVKGSD